MDILGDISKLLNNRDKIARVLQILDIWWLRAKPDLEMMREEWPELFETARDVVAVFAPQLQQWLAKIQPLATFNIKWLQESLNKLGWKLDVDSDYGPATTRAVKEFQAKNGLVVDGWCGLQTTSKIIVELDRLSHDGGK